MKRIVNSHIVTTAIVVMLLSPAYSQDVARNTKTAETQTYSPPSENQSREIKHINDVNSKVLKSFYRSYGEVQNAKWFKTDNGFVVSFKNNELNTNVFYKNSGTVEYTIKYYFEEKLPAEVRHIVKSNFYDYSIILVSEVLMNNVTGYFVKIEDNSTIKTVRVIGEEWEVVEYMIKK
jgi:hypothetical protein